MNNNTVNDKKFLVWLTLVMIGASLWIFKSYLHFLIVAAVLALSTSHLSNALTSLLRSSKKKGVIHQNKEAIGALILTIAFLMIFFIPLLYFVSVTYGQVEDLDITQIKATVNEMVDKTTRRPPCSRDIQTAIRLLLPGELAKHASLRAPRPSPSKNTSSRS